MSRPFDRRKFLKTGAAVAALSAVAPCCAASQTSPAATAPVSLPRLYFNGAIITMEGDTPEYVEAIVIQDEKIVFVGAEKTALSLFVNARLINLQG